MQTLNSALATKMAAPGPPPKPKVNVAKGPAFKLKTVDGGIGQVQLKKTDHKAHENNSLADLLRLEKEGNNTLNLAYL